MKLASLFEYAVLLQEKENSDGEIVDPAAIVIEPTTVLARDPGQAELLAARSIPEEYMDRLDRLQLVVRPF